jgi:glycine/D-amino acid oxidase-like deaminating enzyme
MNTKIFSANLSFSNQIQSLGVVSGNEKQGTLQCDKLIIAAGPWTPGLFNTLFPDSKVDLQPAVDAGDWIICQNTDEPLKSSSDIAAVFLDDIVGHKLEFAGRNDGTIWACCERNHSAIMPPVGEEAEPDDLAIHKLTDYAQEFIIGAEDSLKVVQSGRAFRPARKKGLPVIAAVPTRKLTRNGSWFGHGCIADSVYICSGHGSYGITLGIGSGRLISQIVRGEKPDIDLSEMGIE